MPYVIRRSDKNQEEIVRAIRELGFSAQPIHIVGHGCPDVILGCYGFNLLLEIKMLGKRLTPDEATWHAAWSGQVAIAHDIEEVLEITKAYRNLMPRLCYPE